MNDVQTELVKALTELTKSHTESMSILNPAVRTTQEMQSVILQLVLGLYKELGKTNPDAVEAIKKSFETKIDGKNVDPDDQRVAKACIGMIQTEL
ncbi:hypothetical protein [Massilia sp.]|uniref:hypothetical protein n=1 Tax=Massilia sp. TaxID=1882437 RepID=UPI00352FD673